MDWVFYLLESAIGAAIMVVSYLIGVILLLSIPFKLLFRRNDSKAKLLKQGIGGVCLIAVGFGIYFARLFIATFFLSPSAMTNSELLNKDQQHSLETNVSPSNILQEQIRIREEAKSEFKFLEKMASEALTDYIMVYNSDEGNKSKIKISKMSDLKNVDKDFFLDFVNYFKLHQGKDIDPEELKIISDYLKRKLQIGE